MSTLAAARSAKPLEKTKLKIWLKPLPEAGFTDTAKGGTKTVQVPNVWNPLVKPPLSRGAIQTFTFLFADPSGFMDIAVANVLINSTQDEKNACFLSYDRASNAMFLMNDANTGSTRVDLGSSATAQNNQCMLSGSGSSAAGTGNNLIQAGLRGK